MAGVWKSSLQLLQADPEASVRLLRMDQLLAWQRCRTCRGAAISPRILAGMMAKLQRGVLMPEPLNRKARRKKPRGRKPRRKRARKPNDVWPLGEPDKTPSSTNRATLWPLMQRIAAASSFSKSLRHSGIVRPLRCMKDKSRRGCSTGNQPDRWQSCWGYVAFAGATQQGGAEKTRASGKARQERERRPNEVWQHWEPDKATPPLNQSNLPAANEATMAAAWNVLRHCALVEERLYLQG